MNPASSQLLRDLLSKPRSLGEIADALGTGPDAQSRERLEVLHAMLRRLEQLGLVDRL